MKIVLMSMEMLGTVKRATLWTMKFCYCVELVGRPLVPVFRESGAELRTPVGVGAVAGVNAVRLLRLFPEKSQGNSESLPTLI